MARQSKIVATMLPVAIRDQSLSAKRRSCRVRDHVDLVLLIDDRGSTDGTLRCVREAAGERLSVSDFPGCDNLATVGICPCSGIARHGATWVLDDRYRRAD